MVTTGSPFAAALTERRVLALDNIPISWIVRAVKAGYTTEIIAKPAWGIVNQIPRIEIVTPWIAVDASAMRFGRRCWQGPLCWFGRWLYYHLCWLWCRFRCCRCRWACCRNWCSGWCGVGSSLIVLSILRSSCGDFGRDRCNVLGRRWCGSGGCNRRAGADGIPTQRAAQDEDDAGDNLHPFGALAKPT